MPWNVNNPDLKNDPRYLEPRITELNSQLAETVEQLTSQSLLSNKLLGKTLLHGHGTTFGYNNTIPAFEFLASLGIYQSLEADIHITSDGIWVCTHDDDISLNTNGTGSVANMTYNTLRTFNVTKNGNNLVKFPNSKIPKLEDFLSVCKKNNLIPVMEIKCNMDANKYDSLTNLIKESGIETNCLIMSFNQNHISEMRSRSLVALNWLIPASRNIIDSDINFASDIGNCGLGVNISQLTKSQGQKAQKNGVFVFVWTVQFQFQLEETLLKGANIIGTDNVLGGGVL